jgi:hypothetical protein
LRFVVWGGPAFFTVSKMTVANLLLLIKSGFYRGREGISMDYRFSSYWWTGSGCSIGLRGKYDLDLTFLALIKAL